MVVIIKLTCDFAIFQVGTYCEGWAGNCGEGGRGASSWYLLCESCRDKCVENVNYVNIFEITIVKCLLGTWREITIVKLSLTWLVQRHFCQIKNFTQLPPP